MLVQFAPGLRPVLKGDRSAAGRKAALARWGNGGGTVSKEAATSIVQSRVGIGKDIITAEADRLKGQAEAAGRPFATDSKYWVEDLIKSEGIPRQGSFTQDLEMLRKTHPEAVELYELENRLGSPTVDDVSKYIQDNNFAQPAPVVSRDDFIELAATGDYEVVTRGGPAGVADGIVAGTPWIGGGANGHGSYFTLDTTLAYNYAEKADSGDAEGEVMFALIPKIATRGRNRYEHTGTVGFGISTGPDYIHSSTIGAYTEDRVVYNTGALIVCAGPRSRKDAVGLMRDIYAVAPDSTEWRESSFSFIDDNFIAKQEADQESVLWEIPKSGPPRIVWRRRSGLVEKADRSAAGRKAAYARWGSGGSGGDETDEHKAARMGAEFAAKRSTGEAIDAIGEIASRDDYADFIAKHSAALGLTKDEAVILTDACSKVRSDAESREKKWQDADSNTVTATHTAVQEYADEGTVFVAMPPSVAISVLSGERYKSQFETDMSGGTLDAKERAVQETAMLKVHPGLDAAARPTYGYVKVGDRVGGESTSQYGEVRFALSERVTAGSTIAMGDSLGQPASPVAMRSDVTEREAYDSQGWVPRGGLSMGRGYFETFAYAEAHTRGGFDRTDVAKVYIPGWNRDQGVEDAARAAGIPFEYYDRTGSVQKGSRSDAGRKAANARWNQNRGLGIAREDMPQIPKKNRDKFFGQLRAEGVEFHDETVDPRTLKQTQAGLNPKQTKVLLDAMRNGTFRGDSHTIIAARDGHILDGHHRWDAARKFADEGGKADITITRVDMSIRELLDRAARFNAEEGIEARTMETVSTYAKAVMVTFAPGLRPVLKGDRSAAGTKAANVRWRGHSTQREGFRQATAEDKARILRDHGYKVPEHWKESLVPDSEDSGLVVKGQDQKDKWHYVYSAEYKEGQAAAKFQRIRELHKAMPQLQESLKRDVAAGDDDAIVVDIMRQTGARVGDDSNNAGRLVRDHTYGASNLRAKHITVNASGTVTITYKGKDGVQQRHLIKDPVLAQALAAKRQGKSGNDPLFPNSTDGTTMAYLRRETGLPNAKNHDLRTYVATGVALSMTTGRAPRTVAEYKKRRAAIGKAVAKQLGNTPAVALSTYIDPAVFSQWVNPEWGI